MTVRAVEGKQPYTGGTAIEIDENKVISLRLRDENNLIIYDAGDNEIYVDLQLPDELTPTDAFPVGITTGRVIVDNGWDLQGTLICAKTTSGDNIKLLYADEGTLWIDNGTGTFKQILFKSDIDTIVTTLTTYIDGELAKKQNGVTSATAPTDPAEGDLWYDTAHNTLKVYNGSSWVATGGGGGSGDVVVSTDTGNELSTGVALWFGTESDYSSISTPDTNTLYIQYKSDGGGFTPGADTIAYYSFSDNLNDGSGNGYNLTAQSAAYSYTTGVSGNCCSTSGGFGASSTLTDSIFAGNFTLMFFVKFASVDSLIRMMGCIGDYTNIQYESGQGGLQWYNHNPAGRTSWSWTPVADTWQHIAITGDGTGYTAYLDGVAMTKTVQGTVSQGGNNFYLFTNNSSPSPTAGSFDEVIIESKVWTQQEIQDYLSNYTY